MSIANMSMVMDCVIASGLLSPDPHNDPPGQPLDYVTGALILVCTIPFVIGNVVMVWFREYRPIRSKSVDLTVLSSFGGLVWVAATLVVNDHFGRRKNTIWSVCSLWTFWLQACFGFALWLNCFILRLLNLYFILIMKRGAIKFVVVALLVLLSPIIVFSIFASSYGGSRFKVKDLSNPPIVPGPGPEIEDHHPQGDCSIRRGWAIGLIILVPLYYLVFICLAISLRNIRPQYNEFRLIRNGGILSFFLFLLSLVTFQTKVYHGVIGRCFLAMAVSGAVFYYFWARNWEVVYNVLFNKELYLVNFVAQMNSVPSINDEARDPNPLERLFFDVREEVSSAQAEVQELEQTLGKLQEQYRQEVCKCLHSDGIGLCPSLQKTMSSFSSQLSFLFKFSHTRACYKNHESLVSERLASDRGKWMCSGVGTCNVVLDLPEDRKGDSTVPLLSLILDHGSE